MCVICRFDYGVNSSIQFLRNVSHCKIMSRCPQEINQILRRSDLFCANWIRINLLSSVKSVWISMNRCWLGRKRNWCERDASICHKEFLKATILLIAKLRLVSAHFQHPLFRSNYKKCDMKYNMRQSVSWNFEIALIVISDAACNSKIEADDIRYAHKYIMYHAFCVARMD